MIGWILLVLLALWAIARIPGVLMFTALTGYHLYENRAHWSTRVAAYGMIATLATLEVWLYWWIGSLIYQHFIA